MKVACHPSSQGSPPGLALKHVPLDPCSQGEHLLSFLQQQHDESVKHLFGNKWQHSMS